MDRIENSELDFWPEIRRTYGFAGVMFALAIVPFLNFTYSGHGGISWLVIPLCFPYAILRALIKLVRGSREDRRWFGKFLLVTIPAYIALALPLSWASTKSIQHAFGLQVSTWQFFSIMVSPFPWYYFT
jgi:hypothetical protein